MANLRYKNMTDHEVKLYYKSKNFLSVKIHKLLVLLNRLKIIKAYDITYYEFLNKWTEKLHTRIKNV